MARFIESRGPGLHHVAYQVEDIDAVLAELKESGELQAIQDEWLAGTPAPYFKE